MLRVGLNGFGRIGRAITRIWLEKRPFDLVAINDVNPDRNNIAYLLKYDSTYGRLPVDVASEDEQLVIDHRYRIQHHICDQIDQVPWQADNVDLVIDATGVKKNVSLAPNLSRQGIRNCILTHSPDKNHSCRHVIMGVNENCIEDSDFLLSSSICDANAFVPVMHHLQEAFGVSHGFVTTLHPWLGYQNLLDGPALSYSDPGHIHSTYVLGRSSINALIPKTTSCLSASCKVLPWLEEKFMSLSYRVPTMIVSSADISVKLKKEVSREDVLKLFQEVENRQRWPVIHNSHEALTSVDFTGTVHSAVIDHRWTMVNGEAYCKLILWYDNEWGYSSRVVDLVSHLGQRYGA